MTIGRQIIQKLQTHSAEETVAFGAKLGALLQCGDVLALNGMLGAGKTQLVRGLTQGLGGNPNTVASPTFVLMSEYSGHIPVVHIDAYRIGGLSDLETLGWSDELLSQSVTLVEWAERIASELPENSLEIFLEHAGEANQRNIELSGNTVWMQRLADLTHQPETAQSACSICGAATQTQSRFYPFCSNRCRMVDLGKWFDGNYRIGGEIPTDGESDDLA